MDREGLSPDVCKWTSFPSFFRLPGWVSTFAVEKNYRIGCPQSLHLLDPMGEMRDFQA